MLTRQELLRDLLKAYKDATRHKRSRRDVLAFDFAREDNLVELCDELLSRTYQPRPSTCFIIHDPKMREVFAADFRDRIVHHLFYNYVHTLYERTFVADSYSCIEGRGTHYGIRRLRHHIRSVSAGYSRPCYVLKIDIRGYFMHIDRQRLLHLCQDTLRRMRTHRADESGRTWGEVIDYDFVTYLLRAIINSDPTTNCIRLGQLADWATLPQDKSLFCSAPHCGLPIGNLSSQLFSNVYMNAFDQYVKRKLRCKHYGRYVDDAYIVGENAAKLKRLVPPIKDFLAHELRLTVNSDKLCVQDAYQGVDFLGAYVRPFRTYIDNRSLRRMVRHAVQTRRQCRGKLQASVNSYLGVLSHYDSYRLRRTLFGHRLQLNAVGNFSPLWLKFY